jgi:hypothetical protein
MSTVINSAEELFDILAGDDDEVPGTLIRAGKRESRQEATLIEQMKLDKLNRVEKWMATDGALESDPAEFFSLGEAIVRTLITSKAEGLGFSLVQKLVKLGNLWLRTSKSCRLVEDNIRSDHIKNLIYALKMSKGLLPVVENIVSRFLLALVQCSPTRLFVDANVIESFNGLLTAWSKGRLRFNGHTILGILPPDFLAQLSWPLSSKPFIASKINELVVRVLKKKLQPKIDQDLYIDEIRKSSTQNKKEREEQLIKLLASIHRSKTLPVSGNAQEWLMEVSHRDIKQNGVSVKNVRLAADLLKQMKL